MPIPSQASFLRGLSEVLAELRFAKGRSGLASLRAQGAPARVHSELVRSNEDRPELNKIFLPE
ncbi:MAG TPA: hypothetical protein V6D17_14475 [Candidatus Obscuribacterales bacterium]